MLESDIVRRPLAPVPFDVRLRRLFTRQRPPTDRGRGGARPMHWMWKSPTNAKVALDPIVVKMQNRRMKADMLKKRPAQDES